ncbi:MAG: DUF5722 domain-containing protein [Rubripirellula sp.]|nr:DUF5722 domain-containing protein [Rubripirellula sp.]
MSASLMISLVSLAIGETTVSIVDSNDVSISTAGQEIELVTTGHDPFVVWKCSANPAKSGDHVVAFEYFAVETIEQPSAFLGPPITEATRVDLPDLTQAEGWQSYAADLIHLSGKQIQPAVNLLRLDFGRRAGVSLRLRQIELRKPTKQERQKLLEAETIRQSKLTKDQTIQKYVASDFEATIDQVDVSLDEIQISGEVLKPGRLGALQLFEYPPSISIAADGVRRLDTPTVDGPRFTFLVPRFENGRDRLHSGWRLGQFDGLRGRTEYLTARHFPTSVMNDVKRMSVKRLRPKSQKGLGGIGLSGPLDELPELGVHAITINIVLNSFVSNQADAGQGGVGRERIDDGTGTAAYFDPRPFAYYDRVMEFARQHEMVVSAILLIPRSKRTQNQSPLVHSEADGGIYAMPPMTSPNGSRVYANVLDRIARRYCDPAQSPGGITHWIAHNEIDFHTVWTNMGKQPRGVVMEAYYRSMRMISQAARQYNPDATVFASLTHHWNIPDDGGWQRLSPREVLETLQRYSDMEGSFDWGVAFHPYPQSLFSTVAWNDRDAIDDLDTSYITIQNLQVLGQFMKQPAMRDARGEIRTVLLSEQGFHTADYSERSQQFQSESLSFAMQRVKQMPWIESFHYHRWIDHPDEGGLKLGLRTLPTADNPHGARKQSWYVYQAIE